MGALVSRKQGHFPYVGERDVLSVKGPIFQQIIDLLKHRNWHDPLLNKLICSGNTQAFFEKLKNQTLCIRNNLRFWYL